MIPLQCMRPSPFKIHGALFLVALIYAASYTITKEVTPQYISPRAFIFLRISGSLLLLLIYQGIWIKEKIRDKKDIARLAVCGLFGVAINMNMFFEGLSRTSPVSASLIMVCTPILVLVLGVLLKEESLSFNKIGGILLGTMGAALLIYGGSSHDKASSVLGDLFIFINATSYTIYLVLIRPLMKKYSSITITLWTFSFGFLMVLPFSYQGLGEAHWASMTPIIWAFIIFIVVCTTFMAYTLNAYALRYVKSSVVGTYIYFQPVLATGIAIATGKYTLHWQQAAYASLIFGGVYLASYKPKKTT